MMIGWFQRLHSSYNYCKTYPVKSSFQVGGVLQLATGDITSCITKQGGNDTGQGRCIWQTFKGKNRTLQILLAYRPVQNLSSAGSTWQQQEYYADINNLHQSPHKRWIQDIAEVIGKWKQDGDSIILMANLNDNVQKGKTVQALLKLGLVDSMDATTCSHGPTFQRGSMPIDIIMTTREINIFQGVYVRSASNHICLWIDVQKSSIFAKVSYPTPAVHQRLQCSDPRTVQKYNKALWKDIQRKQLQKDYELLHNHTGIPFARQKQIWEKVDRQLLVLRLNSKKCCRNLRMGRLQWTPELANLRI
jgi:hypothetical protein